MSGHSKWATIHRDKEKNDSKKGVAFTKFAHAITTAVRQGGGFRLNLIIEKARAINMPKDNINRAIERATGAGAASLEEVIFEGFLPGGAAVIIEGLTDNRMRLSQAVREILDKNGGTLGSSGSVSYMFEHLGEIKVQKLSGKSLDEQELDVIDCGASDFEDFDNELIIYCAKEKLSTVKDALRNKGYKVDSMELVYCPVIFNESTDEKGLVSRLEELDEVTKVWTNYA